MTYVKYKIADNAYGILAQDVEIDDTTITLSEQNNLPSDNAVLTLVQKDSNGDIVKSEKVLLTSRNDLVLTVQRGYDGSIAKEFNTGDYVYLFVVSKVVKDIQDEVERLGSIKANDSEVVHKSGDETITGLKTFKGDTPLRFKEASANAYTGFQFQKSDGTIVGEIKKGNSDFIYISHGNKSFYLGKDSGVGIGSIPAGNLANTHSLAIGDNDTGFKRNGDGNLSGYANNQEVFNWTSNLFKFYKNIAYNNEATLSLGYGLNWQLGGSGANSYKFKNHSGKEIFKITDNGGVIYDNHNNNGDYFTLKNSGAVHGPVLIFDATGNNSQDPGIKTKDKNGNQKSLLQFDQNNNEVRICDISNGYNPKIYLRWSDGKIFAKGKIENNYAPGNGGEIAKFYRLAIIDENTGSMPAGITSLGNGFGMGLYADNGPLRFFQGGRTDDNERMRIDKNGGIRIIGGKKFIKEIKTDGGKRDLVIGSRYEISGISHNNKGHYTQVVWGDLDPENSSSSDGGWGFIFGPYDNAYIKMINRDIVIGRNGGKVYMSNLPTSDPSIAGALWNDNGTVKISAG